MTVSSVEGKKKKACKINLFSGFPKKSQKISTHLLTVLTTSAILQLEQRKGTRKQRIIPIVSFMKGDMTYVNAEYFWREFI